MFNVDINTDIILQQQQVLEAALSTNPDTEKALRKLIRKAILDARAEIVSSLKGDFKSGDPREAAKAVRTVVYKAILGANVNIFSSRRAHGKTGYVPTRKLDSNPHMHGGNRRRRSEATQRIMDYEGHDRGFILRFLNSGTNSRTTRYGYRGSIEAKHFFSQAASTELNKATGNLAQLISDELNDILSGKRK